MRIEVMNCVYIKYLLIRSSLLYFIYLYFSLPEELCWYLKMTRSKLKYSDGISGLGKWFQRYQSQTWVHIFITLTTLTISIKFLSHQYLEYSNVQQQFLKYNYKSSFRGFQTSKLLSFSDVADGKPLDCLSHPRVIWKGSVTPNTTSVGLIHYKLSLEALKICMYSALELSGVIYQ